MKLDVNGITRAALDAMAQHIALLDDTGAIFMTNAAWDRFAAENDGDPARVGIGVNYLALCDAIAHEDCVAKQIAAAIRGHLDQSCSETFEIEFPCHSTTEERWFFCRISHLSGQGSARVLVSHDNITPIRKMEVALQRSEALLLDTVKHATLGIGVAGINGRITSANPALCTIHGFCEDELVGRDMDELTHPQDRAKEQTLRKALISGEIPSYSLEKRVLQKSGGFLWIRVTGSLIRNVAGAPEQLVALIEDIHLSKLSELVTQELNVTSTGESLLRKVTQTLASLLEVEFAFVTELSNPASREVKTRAFWAENHFTTNIFFSLEGTPCDETIGETSFMLDEHQHDEPVVIAEQAQQRFPNDNRLVEMEIEAYAGIALWGSINVPLGTLVLMSRRPFRDVKAISTVLKILSPRVAAELRQEQESRKFHELFHNNPSAILMLDSHGSIHMANQACERLFGWSWTALMGQEVVILFPEVEGQSFMRLLSQHVESGLVESTQNLPQTSWAKRRDGSILPIELSLTSLETESGSRTVAYVYDISAQWSVQQRTLQLNEELEAKVLERTSEIVAVNHMLATKEEEIRSLVESMMDLVLSVDESGSIMSANSAITTLLGYTRDEVVGRKVNRFMLVPNYDSNSDSIWSDLSGLTHQVQGLHKNNELIDCELTISEYQVRGQRCFTATLRDTRERVRLMQTLEAARNDAEQASRAKSAFLATMSHEIRTPMNGVVGMVEVLERSPLQGEQIDTVRTIRQSAYALLSIIDDVLDFSKIEAGQLGVDYLSVNVSAVVEGVVDTLDHLAAKKGVELTLFTDPTLPAAVVIPPYSTAARSRTFMQPWPGAALG